MLEKINETVSFLKKQIDFSPEILIILGSGLGGLTDKIIKQAEIPYSVIPHFPISTVMGHGNHLILGELSGKKVAALQGRFHYYEGYTMQQITFPVRALKCMGAGMLIVSNACGGVNPDFRVGDLMIIEDHINLMGNNPLIGPNDDQMGPRFPDMSEPYDKRYIQIARSLAEKAGYRCHVGVYAAVTGPCFETRAEYRFIRTIGADAVGMSTVPEVIVARHMNMTCFGISIVTDIGGSDHLEVITHEEVIKVAKEGETKISYIVSELLKQLPA
jgi:purine-nucleoside phosphorylase